MHHLLLMVYDPVAVWGLVVAIIGVIVGTVAAVAAIYAAVYAKAAPTREDLARVEQNTGTTTGHLENVHSEIMRLNERMDKEPEREALRSLAMRVMPRIVGAIEREAPTAIFTLSTDDANVTFTRVYLVSENRSLVDSVQCEMKSYPTMQQAIVKVDGAKFKEWLAAGTKTGELDWTAYLTVYLTIKGHAGEADIWPKVRIHLENPMAVHPPRNGPWIYRLEGQMFV